MCGKMSWDGDKDVNDHVLLGKIAGQAKRFPEMADHMEAVAANSQYREISFEERNMLSVAFASMIGDKRKELRMLGKLEAEELRTGRAQELKWCRMLRRKIEGEYGEICERILRILDDYLIPVAKSSDAKVAFLKMKADYHRYSAEFQIESNRRQSAESSLIAYKSAQDVAEKTIPPTNPMRLSVALNLSVFYYDILNCPHFALEVAQEAIDEAEANEMDPKHEDFKDSNTIIQLLKDNLLRWSKNLEGRKSST